MNNYKLTIQYDGTNYSGWQIQDNAVTVQGKICDAFKIVLKEDINLIGSGRTDAGVHALGQVANFKTEKSLDMYKSLHSVNSILPYDISIIEMEKVDENFHARFSAKRRSYIYLISKNKSPFYYRYSIRKKYLDVELLNSLSKVFLGEHNFTSFCRKSSEVENKLCNVEFIRWRDMGSMYIFMIKADRFLHGMVRTIVGTLLNAAENNRSDEYLLNILDSKNREVAGEAIAAKGLFLYKVEY